MSEADQIVDFVKTKHGVKRFEVRWKDRKYKDDPWIRPIIDFVGKLFTGALYETDFATSIYPFCYLGTGMADCTQTELAEIVRHEATHIIDQHHNRIWFPLSYVLLAPLVFTMRAHWEERGYAQTLIAMKERQGRLFPNDVEWVVRIFTNSTYGWMDFFGGRKRIEKLAEKVESKEISGFWPHGEAGWKG